jgi:hypothetical protein
MDDPPPADPPPPPDRPAGPPPLPGGDGGLPEARQLPPHRGKLARIGDHAAALSADLREWMELRIALVKAEVQEKVEEVKASLRRKGIAIGFLAAAGVLALYGLGFLFGTLAWGLAALFESVWLGMLVTTLVIFLIAAVLGFVGKRRLDEDQAIEARARVSRITESREGHAPPPSRAQLQDLEAQKARAATT